MSVSKSQVQALFGTYRQGLGPTNAAERTYVGFADDLEASSGSSRRQLQRALDQLELVIGRARVLELEEYRAARG